MKIALLGFDREGRSTLKFLKRSPRFRDAEIWVLDRKTDIAVPRGVHARLGKDYLSRLDEFDVIFRTPGVPYLLPELKKAKRRGTMISSATKLFFEEASAMPERPMIVGITGTKGKGTTSTLLTKMLRAGGLNAHLAGNVGVPALEALPKLKRGGVAVLELSSFQLQDMDRSPCIAAVLDAFPDHQDSHGSLKEYYSAKANISRFQKKEDRIFFAAGNSVSKWIASQGRGKRTAVDAKKFSLFAPEDLRMPGAHNYKNAVMAATIARAMGVSARAITKTARAFKGTEHRLEFVRSAHGVSFYDDSASTIPHTTIAAIRAFPDSRKVLIAGGRAKVGGYGAVGTALRGSGTALTVLFGENAPELKKILKRSVVPFVSAKTLTEAVRRAYRTARASAPAVVIYSPGATSFDHFKNYAERGAQFKKIVRALR